MTENTLVCRRCDCSPEEVVAEGRRHMRCPSCGQQGDYDEVIAVAKEYLKRNQLNKVMHNLDSSFTRRFQSDKNVTYTPDKIPDPVAPDFIFRENVG